MKHYVDNQQANKQINLIANLLERGETEGSIAKALNQRGIKHLQHPEERWTASDVQAIRQQFLSRSKPQVEYKVVRVTEGGCSTLLFGASAIPERKLEKILNEEAKHGWRVVFQVIESKRFLLFWSRESVIVTLEK